MSVGVGAWFLTLLTSARMSKGLTIGAKILFATSANLRSMMLA